jgi:AcrR family transcriptional regulator
MTTLAELALRRPARVDARRNYDKLIAAARTAFSELGTEAPLEEIARRADVGIATLYRNFPTREALIESVYLEEVEAVCNAASEVARLEPWDALVAWLSRFVAYIGTKRALIDGLNRDSSAFKACRDGLYTSGEPLLLRAQQADVVRLDARIDDVMRLVSGIAAAGFVDDDQRNRVLAIALDGLRERRTD